MAKTKEQLEQELAAAKAELETLKSGMDPDDAVAKALADAEAEAEAIRQQAREEAAEIVKDAEASAAKAATASPAAPTTAESAPKHDPGEDLVTVELFKDNGKYKDPLLLAVNGERVMIERGVPVRIKKKFFWALEQSQLQDKATARMIEEKAKEFELATDRISRMV